MNILKDLCAKEIPEPEVRTTYQYVFNLKDRFYPKSNLNIFYDYKPMYKI